MTGQHGKPADERGCARRRCRLALQELQRPSRGLPGRSRAAATTLLVLSIGLGAAAAAGRSSTGATSVDSSSWWSWAQSALTGSRRQAKDAAGGDSGSGEEGDEAQNKTEAPVVPYIAGCVRRVIRAFAPCNQRAHGCAGCRRARVHVLLLPDTCQTHAGSAARHAGAPTARLASAAMVQRLTRVANSVRPCVTHVLGRPARMHDWCAGYGE